MEETVFYDNQSNEETVQYDRQSNRQMSNRREEEVVYGK